MFSPKAQQVYTCRYWFDANHSTPVVESFTDSVWHGNIDVADLSNGIHTLNLQVKDTSNRWNSPRSFMFIKMLGSVSDSSTGNYAYTCWFDQDYASAQTGLLTGGNILLDVDSLTNGVHTVNITLNRGGDYSSTRSYMFIKMTGGASESDSGNYAYTCWFDQDYASAQTGLLTSGNILLDVDSLTNGVHTVNITLNRGNDYTSTHSYMFIKMSDGAVDTNSGNYAYTCWFDQDYASAQTGLLTSGNILLDVDSLTNGVHTVNITLNRGNDYTSTHSYMFIKMSDGAVDTNSGNYAYTCWFDQDYASAQTGLLTGGNILLDVESLRNGVHTVNITLNRGGDYSSTRSYMFIKMGSGTDSSARAITYTYWFDDNTSVRRSGELQSGNMMLDVEHLREGVHFLNLTVTTHGTSTTYRHIFYKDFVGGIGIAKYEYWLNGDYANSRRHTVDPVRDTFNLVGLLPVDTLPIRPECFHFHPTDTTPIIYAKNEITFRFWSNDMRFIDTTRYYVDENVRMDVVADTLERDTTKFITMPTNENIHWFKLVAGVGDSLSFCLDKECTYELYTPSGENVFKVGSSKSTAWSGLSVREDGVYHLAVHSGNGNNASSNVGVSYRHIYKYAVLDWDVHLVGNGAVSTITFLGNGFDSLQTVYLVNSQNDTLKSIYIGHDRNTHSPIAFNFENADTGMYNAIFVFTDEVISVSNVVEVEPALPIILVSNLTYPTTFVRGDAVTYTYEITNTGNMTAYNIPLYTYIGSAKEDGISYIKYDGLDLPSIISGINKDSVSSEDYAIYEKWAEEMGDGHHFYRIKSYDEESGDSVIVRSNYFLLTLKPNETKILTLEIISTEFVEVWFTLPDTISPLYILLENDSIELLNTKGGKSTKASRYCCWKERIDCVINMIDITLTYASFFTGPELAIVQCAWGIIGQGHSKISETICSDDGPIADADIMDGINNFLNWNSLAGTLSACAKKLFPWKKAQEIIDLVDNISAAITLGTKGVPFYNCFKSFFEKKPNCPPGDHKGGKSTPVVPVDPNEIYGYIAESGSKAVGNVQEELSYTIEFENDTMLSTSSAITVIVRDTLDGNVFDLGSFSSIGFSIGEKMISLVGEQNFIRTVDMRPEINALAQVQLEYDSVNGIAKWTFSSLDPLTLEEISNPELGFLPINFDGSGIGKVFYKVNRKSNLPDSAIIPNKAYIVFDNEEPIATSTWVNILDTVSPVSSISHGEFVSDTVTFCFSGTDNNSGLWKYELHGRVDSISPWQLVSGNIYSQVFSDTVNSLLNDFYVIAIDSAGNRETKNPKAEYNRNTGLTDGNNSVTYQISFVNYDGSLLRTNTFASGIMPRYIGTLPTRTVDVRYTYAFRGWNPLLSTVSANATYTAVFDSIPNIYQITFVDKDSTVLQMDSLAYGATPEYVGTIQSLPPTDSFAYTFAGWNPSITPVSGDAIYMIKYDSMSITDMRYYLVTYNNWDGTELYRDSVLYGYTPTYRGENPTKENEYFSYQFVGWSPTVLPISRNATYTARFDSVAILYNIKFVNANGYVLQENEMQYGSMPAYTGDVPTLRSNNRYSYTFRGWNNVIDTVTANATYTAVYDSVIRDYIVRFVDYNGGILQSDTLHYGDTISYRGVAPQRASQAPCRYVFTGWSSERLIVDGNLDYIALYDSILFTIQCQTNDTAMGMAYSSAPQYGVPTVTLTAVANSCQYFSSWSDGNTDNPRIIELNRDTMLVAVFSETQPVETTINASICSGETYTDNGFNVSAAGTYTDTLQTINGCDSVVTLNLTITNSTTGTDVVTACDSYTWIDGVTYTASNNTATYTLTNANGCDSIVTLNLTINNSTAGTNVVTACDSYTWIDGVTYTASNNTATYTLTNANGCDSIVTLNLTINNSSTTVDNVTACDSYTWIDGVTYTESTDSVTYTLTNAAGCDSVVTLNLTVNYAVYDTIVDTAVNEYVWNGTTYTESGVYQYSDTTVAGCDSVVTLILTIQTVGVETADELETLAFYPNPTNGTITFNRRDITKIEVMDAMGRIVAEFENSYVIDLSKLTKGYYTLRITLPEGIAIRKVIRK